MLREVRRGIEAALGRSDDNPPRPMQRIEADEAIDPEIRAEVELAIAAARDQIIEGGAEPSLGEVLEETMNAARLAGNDTQPGGS